ncbi:MAG: primosomal protein N' [Chitinophagaceae bacterium]|nr:primosomal protein N' [Chitinophagaceae bacterium]
MFAEVIIPAALPKNYTWRIPEQLMEKVCPGIRVEVNLGKRKKYTGIVKAVHKNPPGTYETKEILNVLEDSPLILPEQLALWEWIASYYLCSEGEVMAAALPSFFRMDSETLLVWNDDYGDLFDGLDDKEFIVAEALMLKKQLTISEVRQLLDIHHVLPVINRLMKKNICFVWESLKEGYKPRQETYIQLNPEYDNEKQLAFLLNEDKRLQRAEKQMELLLSYLHLRKTEGEVTKSSLLKKSGASDAQLKVLLDKNILIARKRNVDRIRLLPGKISIDFTLSPQQQKAFEEVMEIHQHQKDVCLLHGVTSSGKTHIYIKLIEYYLNKGFQILYMLPEIALTSQIIRRLEKHFGGYVGVYHSRFSQHERVEIWNKVKEGDIRIILGARSALFLPFRRLGLIICDEEHDTSFKQQDPAPRYHARDTAICLASLFKAKVLLGSGTPSLESYYHAQSGKYGRVELTERYGELKLPPLTFIDMTQLKQKQKSKVIFSEGLIQAIRDTMARGRQVILFQNRRGYAPYQQCQTCGWIPQCRYCDVSLTYHKGYNKWVCHYCGTQYPLIIRCAACGSDKLLQRNFGTEKLEEQLTELFPDAHTARMDIDAVRGKHAHEKIIQMFEQQKINILVGTQMVVKGLDFEHVDLVGIPNADSLLHFTDFRVYERAFQLIEQVSGRAGRKEETGKVIIQTSQPKHPLFDFLRKHDYKGFFEFEIKNRKQFFYPPFSRIIKLTFRHKTKEVSQQASYRFADMMKTEYGKFLVGPAAPLVSRVRNFFLMELMLKLPPNAQILKQSKEAIRNCIAVLHQDKKFRSVSVIADIDPM